MAGKGLGKGLGKGVGKGVDSIIADRLGHDTNSSDGKGTTLVDISKIEPNQDQPRKKFDEDALIELSDSIKLHGIIQPLAVQKRDGYYEIIAGERRWRAAKMAGLKEVPVMVMDLSDQEIAELRIIENIQRQDLNPIEEALAYKRLLNEFNLKQDEVAERVSKSRTAVTNSMRLLKLDERVQQMLIDDMIASGHARALLGIEDHEKQYELAQKVFDEKMNVRDVEKLVKKQNEDAKAKTKPTTGMPDEQMKAIYSNLEEQLKVNLGTKVSIVSKDMKKGKIEIEFYSPEELDRITEIIKK